MQQESNFIFMTYLAGLSMIGFLATDMYLPAFEAIRVDLNTTENKVSASLSLFLGGYALAQLIWGPISDHFGKRTAILSGLLLFVLSSIAIFVSDSVLLILAFRLTQAMGVCAAAVSWQALAIDYYPIEKTKRVFATIMPLVALSPALAPLLGTVLQEHFGWRSIFIALALIALLLMAYTFTLSKKTKPNDNEIKVASKSYLSFLKSQVFTGNVIIYASCTASFFAWLTGSPFILHNLGYSASVIGWSYVPQTIAFLIGGFGYRNVSTKIENDVILPKLLIVYSICMVALFLEAILLTPNLTLILIPFCLMAFVNGACYPIVVSDALTPFHQHSGKASALLNFLQLSACFISSTLVSVFSNNPLLTTTIVMLATVGSVVIGYRIRKNA